ncbi:hypothetical protein GGR50DRAFT_673727 [Xylaria sp. CBS 124048]|nr:hypothetical protein GGR50DRAFT_673727 [Xylaria sp. CBS 124048]
MVEEGENDSFDTTFRETFDVDEDEDEHSMSSGAGQSQMHSFSFSQAAPPSSPSLSSKDGNTRECVDDSQVILRIPFQPSIAAPRPRPSVETEYMSVPQHIFSAASMNGGLERSRRSVGREPNQVRRRAIRDASASAASASAAAASASASASFGQRQGSLTPSFSAQADALTPNANTAPPRPSLADRFTTAAPELMFDCVAWVLSVIGMAFRMVKSLVAVVLAIYVIMAIITISKNRIVRSATTALKPICTLPGVLYLDLPFCQIDNETTLPAGPNPQSPPLEFNELMHVQSQIEMVAADSANKVSLPLEMKKTEASVRDLRTMVKYSELPVRDELVFEFDGYIDAIRRASRDLQSFNTQVESVVDSLISINRWTARHLDSLSAEQDSLSQGFMGWLLAPFRPGLDEEAVLDKYTEHIALVSGEVEKLIVRAQATLTHLNRAENHVHSLQEHAVRGRVMVSEQRSEVFWDLWTLVGANTRRLNNLKGQLSLLRRVEGQRHAAMSQLTAALDNLDEMGAKLSDLRDRVAKPGLLAGVVSVPVRVHVDTIDAALARLVALNSRSRAEAAEKWRRALELPIVSEDRLIDR